MRVKKEDVQMDLCERDDEKWIKGMSMHDVKRNF